MRSFYSPGNCSARPGERWRSREMRFDSFELSKIAGAFLSAFLVIVGFKVALEIAEHGKAG